MVFCNMPFQIASLPAWWPNAGLLLPVTLPHHLGLGELVDSHVDLGDAPGRANTGDKIVTLVASALAGGDCIDDADALRNRRDGPGSGLCGQGAIHPWGRSCAASGGARSVSWTGWAASCCPRLRLLGPGPATC